MDLIDDRAILGDEEDDEELDEETGEPRGNRNGTNGRFDDSSEEDDEDDEEAAAEVARGFIVDEDEEDEETRQERRRERKKRRREEREREEEGLDEEDLELIGLKPAQEDTEPKFKRLKRGPREDRDIEVSRGVNDIFRDESDEEEPPEATRFARPDPRGLQDEFDDFIEEDVFSDDEQQRAREDMEVARSTRRGLPDLGIADAAGLDEQALQDFRDAFGDGTDYDFALAREDEADLEDREKDKHLDLKDVFEPSQLEEKMLTDADNEIRLRDEPERHQLARKPYQHVVLTEEQFKEEAQWICNLMLPKKQFTSDLQDPFRKAISQVLEFMTRDDFEVPFIFQNRKDYLIHAVQRPVGRNDDGSAKVELDATKLLNQDELWDIFEFDLKFRGLVEKRGTLQRSYDELKSNGLSSDSMFEEMLPVAATMEELQDLQEYLHFQYEAQLKDLTLTAPDGETNGAGISRKKAATSTIYEEIRKGKVYGLVRGFGISADAFAKNALKEGVKTWPEDPSDSPENMADDLIDEEFSTGTRVLKAGRAMFTEELVMSPRLRKFMRQNVYVTGMIDCHRTEKGLRKIDDQHAYFEFKYLRNQDFGSIARQPDLYLRMLKAEEEGLVEVKVRLQNHDQLKKQIYKHVESDNISNVADAWNATRREVVSSALDKLVIIMGKLVKENLKTECENAILSECRAEFFRKLDQAPYQPRGMRKGTTPRVLALTNGNGISGKDPIHWAFISDDGRVLENGKFVEIAPGDRDRSIPDGKDVDALLEVIRRREVEVIGMSGFSPETRKLHNNLTTLVTNHDLRGPAFNDDNDQDRSELLEVVLVNDEVARLYQNSDRAKTDHPGLLPLTHYCVALGRYMQDPLKEYAALGRDVTSLSFSSAQNLLPEDKLMKKLETALVDNVSLVGIDVNEAISDPLLANLLTYAPGLGPRKAQHLLKTVNFNGGFISSREDLLGLGENQKPAMGLKVWNNCASTLYVPFDQSEDNSEYLDGTRIHPEDYDIARKMAADALELDEEDIESETKEFGSGAIVRRLVKEEAQDRVNDLVLEEYAEQLEKNLNSKKRATLENIRAEIIEPYEELRNPFVTHLSEMEIFTMLTGETRTSLAQGMNVPISLKRVTDTTVEGKLDCGIEAHVLDGEATDSGTSPKQLYSLHQTVQAHIMQLDRKNFTTTVSLRDEYVRRPYKRFDPKTRGYGEWDEREEAADKKTLEQKSEGGTRATRVIKHPLFRAFNSKQAEEYLANQGRGDCVIRPSSKGTDHLAVTWKVADGIFQHIDVLELDKENEFSLGRTLRVGGKYSYSDLDELIVMHIKTMAKKVDEMLNSDKFQDKSKAALDEWLTTYTNANPKRSMYQFCLNRERPGQFHLCFKAGQKARLMDWSVRVIPQGFELMKQPYPTMRDLCNGFKLLFGNMQNAAAVVGPRGGGVVAGGGGGGWQADAGVAGKW